MNPSPLSSALCDARLTLDDGLSAILVPTPAPAPTPFVSANDGLLA